MGVGGEGSSDMVGYREAGGWEWRRGEGESKAPRAAQRTVLSKSLETIRAHSSFTSVLWACIEQIQLVHIACSRKFVLALKIIEVRFRP